jgi:hypothetical protein
MTSLYFGGRKIKSDLGNYLLYLHYLLIQLVWTSPCPCRGRADCPRCWELTHSLLARPGFLKDSYRGRIVHASRPWISHGALQQPAATTDRWTNRGTSTQRGTKRKLCCQSNTGVNLSHSISPVHQVGMSTCYAESKGHNTRCLRFYSEVTIWAWTRQ